MRTSSSETRAAIFDSSHLDEQRVCQLVVPLPCRTVAPDYRRHTPCDQIGRGGPHTRLMTMWREGLLLALGFAIAGGGFARRRLEPNGPTDRTTLGEPEQDPDDLRDRFLGTISHELRTPLNTIIGWAQMLRTGQLSTSEVSHAIAAIDRNARREVQLIDDLLDVSRMQGGRLRIRREPLDFAAVVREVISVSQSTADTAGVALRLECADGPLRVLGDRSRLEQMVRHAVANAIKFTPRGGHVGVRLAKAGLYAELAIADDGVGIARRYARRVFEPFFQAPSRVPRSGLGLGLTIIQELVGAHHGSVTLTTRDQGAGSVLTIQLPLTRALPQEPLVRDDAAAAGRMRSAPAFG
jgi:signal transduction histidine kinase